MKNILCLDFDGVICDSIKECFLVAYNSYMKMENKGELIVKEVNSISNDIAKRFYKYRYLVRPAKDFWLLIHLIINRVDNIDEMLFVQEQKKYLSKINAFENVFYDTREELIEKDLEYWMCLNKFYKEFLDNWSLLINKFKIYIVTNKNKEAVNILLKRNLIAILGEQIIAKEDLNSKIEALKMIAEKNNKSLNEIYFVDDSPATIMEIHPIIPNSYLAAWGYYNRSGNIKSLNNLSELI